MEISKEQIAAAVALLGKTQAELAAETGLSTPTVSNFLKFSSSHETKESTKKKIVDYLRSRGIEFLEEDGIRRRPSIFKLTGVEGFRAFMNDVYETAKEFGGDICLFNSKPRLWYDYLGKDWYDMHAKRMADLGDKIRVRITVQEGEDFFILGTALHKWFPKLNWKEKIVYVYGPKLAFLDFSGDDIRITVMNSTDFAESFRVLFDIAWDSVAVLPPQAK